MQVEKTPAKMAGIQPQEASGVQVRRVRPGWARRADRGDQYQRGGTRLASLWQARGARCLRQQEPAEGSDAHESRQLQSQESGR